MIRYAITDGSRFGMDADARFTGLMQDAARWVDEGIEFVQLREKDLNTGELLRIARAMVKFFCEHNAKAKLLVNGRADVALAADADGVHLTAAKDELTAEQVRFLFAGTRKKLPLVSMSCHRSEDVMRACEMGVNLILFGPIFEKRVNGVLITEGCGLKLLQRECESAKTTSVLAIGGITTILAKDCIAAGADGIAGIRLFQ